MQAYSVIDNELNILSSLIEQADASSDDDLLASIQSRLEEILASLNSSDVVSE